MQKIIITKGDIHTPHRFWSRIVCKEDEYSVKMQNDGWVKTQSREYLDAQQLNYLNEAERNGDQT